MQKKINWNEATTEIEANHNQSKEIHQIRRDASVPNSNTSDSAKKALTAYFAYHLNTSPENITNYKLYTFIQKWLHTPYLLGGNNKYGIDCSSFVKRLIKDVYGLNLPGTSIEQLYTNRVELFRSKIYLSEGDIVFFRLSSEKTVSHVGIYLKNNVFVHSCNSKGVSMAALTEAYWKMRLVVAGRIKEDVAKK
ncbi:C40 family peptidase [Segetibacter sp. 3557_3]|uniref:C40 family peptidase n=1 Tax=Segetibacter sp. 3557_3 TaxID=2547429 RepID=UPI0014046CF8|nr:NlpC/P60 family protein [Segetibacter sp. 3557_3]